jgi:hypothetical protein
MPLTQASRQAGLSRSEDAASVRGNGEGKRTRRPAAVRKGQASPALFLRFFHAQALSLRLDDAALVLGPGGCLLHRGEVGDVDRVGGNLLEVAAARILVELVRLTIFNSGGY